MGPVSQLPLWVRYVVGLVVALALFIALVAFVHHNSGPLAEPPSAPDAAQAAQQQKEDRILVAQQQAPHRTSARAVKPQAAASVAVLDFMRSEVNRAFITGPLDGGVSCRSAGGIAIRLGFRCRIKAGPPSATLLYPFDVVVAPMVRRVTFCQVITSPDPSVPSPPVSSDCRA